MNLNVNAENRFKMLLDRLIIGIYDKRLQLKLLDNKNKGLDEVVQECKPFEASTINTEILHKTGVSQQTVDETTQDKKGIWSVKGKEKVLFQTRTNQV